MQLGLNFSLQKHRGDADPDVPERVALTLDRKMNVVDAGRSKHDFQLLQEAAVTNLLKVAALLQVQVGANRVGIGVHDSAAVDVRNGRIGNRGRITDHRLQQGVQAPAELQLLLQHRIHLAGIVLGGKCAAQIGQAGCASALPDFLGDEVGAIVGLVDALPHQTRDVKVGKYGDQRNHHATDGKHQFCLQTHMIHKKKIRWRGLLPVSYQPAHPTKMGRAVSPAQAGWLPRRRMC